MKLSLSVFLIIALFFVLTIPTISFWPDDQDSVNFLMGIDQFSLQFHQPHFPGYPVYIAICKALKQIAGVSAEESAVFISMLSGVGVLLVVFLLIEKKYTGKTALISISALAVNPLFFEFSHKIFSEMPALFLLLCGVYALGEPDSASSRRWFLSLFIFVIMIGVRVSWWPFPFFYLIAAFRYRHGLSALSAVVVGILLWLIPLIWVVGLWDFYSEGVSFIYGHFYNWGGSVLSNHATKPRVLSIFFRIGEVLGFKSGYGNLITLLWGLIQIWGIFFFISYQGKVKETTHYFQAATVYMGWVFLGQNLEKARHFMPIVPLVILMAASLIHKWPKIILMIVLLLGAGMVNEYSARTFNTPPAVRFSEWLNKSGGTARNIYCGSSERFFDRYPARYDNLISVSRAEELDSKIKTSLQENSDSLICDDIFGFKILSAAKPVITFPARLGDPVDRTLQIYKLSETGYKTG